MPELREDDSFTRGPASSGYGNQSYGGGQGYGGGGYGGNSSFGGNRGGYGNAPSYGNRGGYGGGAGGFQPSQGRGGGGASNSDERTVFVGNLGFSCKETEVSDVFRRDRINPVRIRML